MMQIIQSVMAACLSLLQLVLLVGLLYHYALLLASIPRPRLPKQTPAGRFQRLALILPAHNEAAVIGKSVRGLLSVDYPRELFDVFVVADHCQDETARMAREAGAICYERNDGPRGRKGYALAWLLERVMTREPAYDAFIIFDADSQINPKFLEAMNAGLAGGGLVLQGQHRISNAEVSLYNRLAAIDMRLNNRLRNAARHNAGSSARLMGDAMCFARAVLERYPWNTFSLVEDMEYGIQLLLEDVRILYIPEAISYGQAAGGWTQAERQRLRWSGGMLDMRRRLALRLLKNGVQQRRMALLDRGLELLLPPYSTLALLSVVLLVVQLLWQDLTLLLPASFMIGSVLAWAAFPFVGLLLDRAPRALFAAMLSGPFYLLWRVWISVLAIMRGKRVQWVRTPRSEEA